MQREEGNGYAIQRSRGEDSGISRHTYPRPGQPEPERTPAAARSRPAQRSNAISAKFVPDGYGKLVKEPLAIYHFFHIIFVCVCLLCACISASLSYSLFFGPCNELCNSILNPRSPCPVCHLSYSLLGTNDVMIPH